MKTLSALAEDALEYLYMREVEDDTSATPTPDDRTVGELERHALVHPGGLSLTPAGRVEAEQAVRRHRLAERLLQDVIAMRGAQVNEAACEFEHSLHHGVDEYICTLLGHPTTCPHGRPIPPGRCCRERKGASHAAIVTLEAASPASPPADGWRRTDS